MTETITSPISTSHPDYQPNMVDYESAKLLFIYDMGDVTAQISKGVDDSGFIRWTDHVANEWIEHFSSVSIALMRLAALQACGETCWETVFVHTPKGFERIADKFVNEVIG